MWNDYVINIIQLSGDVSPEKTAGSLIEAKQICDEAAKQYGYAEVVYDPVDVDEITESFNPFIIYKAGTKKPKYI